MCDSEYGKFVHSMKSVKRRLQTDEGGDVGYAGAELYAMSAIEAMTKISSSIISDARSRKLLEIDHVHSVSKFDNFFSYTVGRLASSYFYSFISIPAVFCVLRILRLERRFSLSVVSDVIYAMIMRFILVHGVVLSTPITNVSLVSRKAYSAKYDMRIDYSVKIFVEIYRSMLCARMHLAYGKKFEEHKQTKKYKELMTWFEGRLTSKYKDAVTSKEFLKCLKDGSFDDIVFMDNVMIRLCGSTRMLVDRVEI